MHIVVFLYDREIEYKSQRSEGGVDLRQRKLLTVDKARIANWRVKSFNFHSALMAD